MNLTLNQKMLQERILLNMRYKPSLTLSENILLEQSQPKKDNTYIQTTPKLDLRHRIDRLTDEEVLSTAKKWGWSEPNWIPVAYVDSKKMELKIGDAKTFLNKIGWPKFGTPPKTEESNFFNNPEIESKIKKDIDFRKAYSRGEYGYTNIQKEPGYIRCVDIFSSGNQYNTLPLNVLEAYKDLEEYCKFNFAKYAPPPIDEPLNIDPHLVLQIAAFISLFIPVVGPVVSGVLELADVSLYLQEKDYESAGIALAFSLIPAANLINKIPVVKKFTSGALKKFLKNVSKRNPLSRAERQLKIELKKYSKWIAKEIAEYGAKSTLKILFSKRIVGKTLIRLLLYLTRAGVLSAKAGVKLACLGGTFVTFGWIGKKLGQGLEYINTGELEKLDSETEKKLAKVNPKKLEQEIIQLSPQISKDTEKSVNDIIEMSSEEKNKNIQKVLSKADELILQLEN